MTDIFTRAIPVVEPPAKGVHLIWTGPPEFIYSPGGWRIERRDSLGPLHTPSDCDVFNSFTLSGAEELRLLLGVMVVSQGLWPGPEGGPCLICTLELNPSTAGIHGFVTDWAAFICGMRNGKAAALAGPLTGAFDLGATPLDTVVMYLRSLAAAPLSVSPSVRICRYHYEKDDWSNAKLLANLQLPLQELMPALTTPAAEFAEAKSRLLPGESIDAARFGDFMNLIRGISKTPPLEPIQNTLLARTAVTDEFDEMCLLDPLRMTYSSPLWRRALGFSYLDSDPALVAGNCYDYRITGSFPGSVGTVFGFHTIPSGTALPRDFYLHDCRFRLPAPAVVSRAPSVAQSGLKVNTRRGIGLEPQPGIPWIDGLLDQYGLVVDLPVPTTSVALSLDTGHQLTIEGGVPWGAFTAPIPIPPVAEATITFPQPVTQLRIAGTGFLFALVSSAFSSSGGTHIPVPVIVSPVLLVNTPRPAPPVSAEAASLQAAASLLALNQIKPRRMLGIDVQWEPATAGPTIWPATEIVPPPLEVTSFQVERRIEPNGPWQPVIGGENLVLGNRDEPPRDTAISSGADLMETFPESGGPRSAGTQFLFRDVFMTGPEGEAQPKPPAPGTMLRYQIGAVDAAGRPSATFTQTDPVRLEKHEPPPIPAAPDQRPADALPSAGPTGVFATVLVRSQQGLTPQETALLGSSDNVIILNWGWHAKQRTIDPFANQFRLYLAPPLDEVSGQLVSATPDPTRAGVYQVQLQLDRQIAADAARNQYLDAGYPFFIETHSGSVAIQATVRTAIAAPGGEFRTPTTGPITLQLNYSNQLTRATGWRERLEPAPGQRFVPITAAEQYQAVIRDRLQLTDAHPRDSLWVGVSAADSQAYVPDTFTGVNPGGPLSGNESAVAGVLCQGKRFVRPDYQPPPPAGAASRIITPEPSTGTVHLHLDLAPYMAGSGLPGGAHVMHERLHSVDLLSAYAVVNGQLMGTPVNARPDETNQPVSIPNPSDLATIISAISAGDFEGLDDRFLVLLAHLHPFRARLFQAVSEDPVATLDFDESLPPIAARYVYRVRKANAMGQLSVEGIVANAVVRVPSPMPGPRPVPDAGRPTDPEQSLRFLIPDYARLTHLLVFRAPASPDASPGSQLIRVPNRPDLAPAGNIRLRLDDNSVLTPLVIPLSTLEHDASGWRAVIQPSQSTGPERVWLATVTADGVPCPPTGPWRFPFTPPPPPAPSLSVTAVSTELHFVWTWPGADKTPLVVERSADGISWQRISPLVGTNQASFETAKPAVPLDYRLRLRSSATLPVVSNVVTA